MTSVDKATQERQTVRGGEDPDPDAALARAQSYLASLARAIDPSHAEELVQNAWDHFLSESMATLRERGQLAAFLVRRAREPVRDDDARETELPDPVSHGDWRALAARYAAAVRHRPVPTTTEHVTGASMDLDRARQLLEAERQRIRRLLATTAEAELDDSAAERDAGDGDIDAAQPLEHEAVDIAIERSLRERLDAIERAAQRIENGTYGKSIESGLPIPDDRLAVDPAAELTVAEAARRRRRD